MAGNFNRRTPSNILWTGLSVRARPIAVALLGLCPLACSQAATVDATQTADAATGAPDGAWTADVDAATLPTVCPPAAPTLTIPPAPLAPSLLPGETTACAALGIATCSTSSCMGLCDSAASTPGYLCYNSVGAGVALGKDGAPCLQTSACSNTQLQAWLDAYPKCSKPASGLAIPQSLLQAVLKPEAIAATVCSNADGTRFSFIAGCALHEYTLLDEDHCGNIGGGSWRLRISPPTAVTLQPALQPLAQCAKVQFWFDHGRYGFSVAREADALVLNGEYGCGACTWDPVDAKWPERLAHAVAAFTTCDAKYDLP